MCEHVRSILRTSPPVSAPPTSVFIYLLFIFFAFSLTSRSAQHLAPALCHCQCSERISCLCPCVCATVHSRLLKQRNIDRGELDANMLRWPNQATVTGRPGAAYVDIPSDVLMAPAKPSDALTPPVTAIPAAPPPLASHSLPPPDAAALKSVLGLLRSAKRYSFLSTFRVVVKRCPAVPAKRVMCSSGSRTSRDTTKQTATLVQAS